MDYNQSSLDLHEKLKGKLEEFEAVCSELEKDNKASLTEAEDAKAKAIQLQEVIERY